MAEHIWSLLCERQLVDPESGVISLMDLRENVTVDGLEKMLEDAAEQGKKGTLVSAPTLLVSWWHRSSPEEEVFHVRYGFVSPEEKRITERTADFSWQADNWLARIFVKFDTLPCSMPGLYWFHVEQRQASEGGEPRWDLITRIPLHIGPA
jgi:hypothetical protein